MSQLNESEVYHKKALAPDVLCVAVVNTRVEDWSAYIKAVPGKNHIKEANIVIRYGSKLSYSLAKILFPTLDKKYFWRY